MASSLTSSFQTSNLRSAFLGERNGFFVCSVSVSHVRFLKKTIECKESRIGKQPIEVPSNVTITLEGQALAVKGPLGQLSLTYPRSAGSEGGFWGSKALFFMVCSLCACLNNLLRTLTDNMVVGVSKGFDKRLQLVGVGYRATLEGKILVLSLGFSHPVEENTRTVVSGYDQSAIGPFAGVKYADEIIRRKEGKAGKKK
ncbi:50S ribosomal protein L6 [Pyrus ussuriensis x Pyrus communis]|uniref:50S ribosomal protein L6 n=1 Tax=Pyrus ussuriensis x Pyrus communis TaxID=2448454 RepID=A0A5N5GK32_9ROSA|nr:50S ribosomal protein L6 [Pyrus ussuriensis x Pyrus communis]